KCGNYSQRPHYQGHCYVVDVVAADTLEENDRNDQANYHTSQVLSCERLEQVSASTRLVSHIIPNIVGDRSRVPRIVLRKVLLPQAWRPSTPRTLTSRQPRST